MMMMILIHYVLLKHQNIICNQQMFIKDFILFMIIIPEVISFLFILSYLKDYIETFINVLAFALSLIIFIFLKEK